MSGRIGDAVYRVEHRSEATGGHVPGIVDEQRKLNINTAERAMLQDLNAAITAQVAKAIVARRLERPFQRVLELAEVDGIDRAFLTDPRPGAKGGLISLLTTYGDGRVNVNTASAAVLGSLGTLTAEQAEKIIARRNGEDGLPGTEDDTPFTSVDEVKTLLEATDKAFAGFGKWLAVSSTHFTLAATAHPADSPTLRRKVERVVRREADALVVEHVWTGQ